MHRCAHFIISALELRAHVQMMLCPSDLEQAIRDAPADGPSATQYDGNKISSSSNSARPKVFIILILSSLLTTTTSR